MRIESAECKWNNRAASSAFMTVFLCVCAILLVTLLTVSAAFGESRGGTEEKSWEEQLEAARKKYNKNTVNVYFQGRGRYNRYRKVNICFYPADEEPYISINIRESLKITDEAEIQAVLEVLAASPYYSEEAYGSIPFMKAQWITHNLAHSMAKGTEEQQMLVRLVAGEDLTTVISRAVQLDMSELANMPEQEIAVYEMVEALLGLDRN